MIPESPLNSHQIEHILEVHGIRVSPTRVLTIKALSSSESPLSAAEIEQKLDTVDRSSITRTLSLLCDARVIHPIPNASGSMKYELCDHFAHDRDLITEHAHFQCKVCGKTICMKDIVVPRIGFPKYYQIESVSLLATGICNDCKKK